MLQYDNSAFHYFAISTLVFYLVPSWYSIMTRVYSCFSLSDAEIGAEVRTQSEKKKALNLKKEFKGLSKLKTPGFIVTHVFTINPGVFNLDKPLNSFLRFNAFFFSDCVRTSAPISASLNEKHEYTRVIIEYHD